MKLSTSLILITGLAMTATASAADGFVSEFTASPWEPHGVLVGQTTRHSENLHPVIFTHVNGRRVTGGRDALWLKPGEYSIKATIMGSPSQRRTPGPTRSPGRNDMDVEPLQIVVEEGMQYRIAGRHTYDDNGRRRDAFSLVLWKVTGEDGEETYPMNEEEEQDESEEEEMEDSEAERIDTDSD